MTELKQLTYDSAMKHGCPEDMFDDVWIYLRKFQLPTTRKEIDNDVIYAMKELGISG